MRLDSPDEEAKIKQSMEQYIRCGQDDCLNVDGGDEAINEGRQSCRCRISR